MLYKEWKIKTKRQPTTNAITEVITLDKQLGYFVCVIDSAYHAAPYTLESYGSGVGKTAKLAYHNAYRALRKDMNA